MGEHYANIWRLDRLPHGHVLTVVCGRCAYREPLQLPEVRALHPELGFVHEIEPWLICNHCGNRERNRAAVITSPAKISEVSRGNIDVRLDATRR